MQSNPADLNVLVSEIDDIVTVTRGRVVELREALAKGEVLLAAREDKLKEIQADNENLKKEIFDGGPSPEFVTQFENEVEKLRAEITEARQIIDSLGAFSKNFEDQLLTLVDLDKKATQALVDMKYRS